MTDSLLPSSAHTPHAIWITDPGGNRYALKVNADGSINVTGGSGGNNSVGLTGTVAPTSATEIGFIDGSGNLVAPSAVNPLPISGSFSASFTEPVLNVVGTISSAAVLSNYPLNPTTGYRTVAVQITVLGAGNTVIAEESNDGTTWYGIQSNYDTTVESATPMSAIGKYIFPVSGLQFRLRCSVYAAGAATANAEFRQNPPSEKAVGILGPVLLGAGSAIVGKFGIDQTTPGTTNGVQVNAALPAGSNQIGTVGLVAGVAKVGQVAIDQTTPGTTNAVSVTNFPATQPVSGTILVSNFPSTVDTNAGAAGASTLRVVFANTQTVGLAAGTAIVGKFGIDQTTPGTTNAVSVSNLPTTVDTNVGAAGASTVRVAFASSSTIGLVAGTALVGKVGLDQTTPGTTNAVSLSQIGSTTVLAGTGAVGAGAQRIAVGTDTATIAGSAPGTAGTPSTNVLTVQGAASMTALAEIPDTAGFVSGAATATAVTSTQVIALVAAKRIYVTGYSLSNSSATPVTVSFQDGSGGATLWTAEVPAGGGNNMSSNRPLFRTTAGNGLYAASSAGVTTAIYNAAGFSQ